MDITYSKLLKLDQRCICDVAEIFNENFSEEYNVNEKLLHDKLFSCNDFFPEGSFMAFWGKKPVGFIAVKVYRGIIDAYRDTAFISLFAVKKEFQHNGLGKELLRLSEKELNKLSIKKLCVSQDMRNLFAGIPNPCESSVSFFKNQGFNINSDEHWDVTNDISVYPLEAHQSEVNITDEYKTVPAEMKDVPALSKFMKSEFPGRWDYEISLCFNEKDIKHILLLKHQNDVKGFCRIRHGGDTDGIEFYLGSDCGALGPIGIANDIRKLGLGKRILYDALLELKNEGAHKVNIDWTALKDFYGTFGFKPWRTYRGAYKTY